MSGVVENIRAKLKRRFSHKDKDVNFDDVDSADEETNDLVNKEYTAAETDDANPYGKSGSLINRMILHGNKKTEEQLMREQQGGQAVTGQSVAGQEATKPAQAS